MGLTQVNTSYYLGQSYHIGRNSGTIVCDTVVHRDGGKCVSKCAETAKRCV